VGNAISDSITAEEIMQKFSTIQKYNLIDEIKLSEIYDEPNPVDILPFQEAQLEDTPIKEPNNYEIIVGNAISDSITAEEIMQKFSTIQKYNLIDEIKLNEIYDEPNPVDILPFQEAQLEDTHITQPLVDPDEFLNAWIYKKPFFFHDVVIDDPFTKKTLWLTKAELQKRIQSAEKSRGKSNVYSNSDIAFEYYIMFLTDVLSKKDLFYEIDRTNLKDIPSFSKCLEKSPLKKITDYLTFDDDLEDISFDAINGDETTIHTLEKAQSFENVSNFVYPEETKVAESNVDSVKIHPISKSLNNLDYHQIVLDSSDSDLPQSETRLYRQKKPETEALHAEIASHFVTKVNLEDDDEIVIISSDEEFNDIEMAIKQEEHCFDSFLETLKSKDMLVYNQPERILAIQDEIKELKKLKRKQQAGTNDISDSMIDDLQTLLRHFGIPFITAPLEAEAACAYLEKAGQIHGVVTDDSDVFLFGNNF
jgi:hypothetical protein